MVSKAEAVDRTNLVNRDNLSARLLQRLRAQSPATCDLLNTLCHLAELRQTDLYVVGGALRDLLLDQPISESDHLDLDLAVDGDPAPLHSALSEAAAARATIHDRFGTASVTLADGASIDLVHTRSERYPSPGALPIVTPAPIDLDLQRRDFTINAAAIALSGVRAGELIDPHGAIADLTSRRIRTLHPQSFRDDPTRLIRAARYAARIGGTIERRTLADARRDRGYLQALTPERFGDAWRLLLRERDVVETLEFARRLRIPQSRDARWTLPKAVLTASDYPDQFWAVSGLLSREPAISDWLPRSVGMNRRERAALEAGASLRRARRSIGQLRRPSSVALILKRFPDSALEAAQRTWAGGSGASQRAVANFLERRERAVSPLTPGRLMELGVERGPQLGRWLERIESAIWDGELHPSDPSSVARMEQRIRCSQ